MPRLLLLSRIIKRQIHFNKAYIGRTLRMEDGKRFVIIRNLEVDHHLEPEVSAAVFKVRFKFSGLSVRINRRLSFIPAPFLMAKSGFHQKIWAVSEDGYFQGLYQWATTQTAQSYPQSFIFKVMTKRSVQGTLVFDVIPDTSLSNYLEVLLQD